MGYFLLYLDYAFLNVKHFFFNLDYPLLIVRSFLLSLNSPSSTYTHLPRPTFSTPGTNTTFSSTGNTSSLLPRPTLLTPPLAKIPPRLTPYPSLSNSTSTSSYTTSSSTYSSTYPLPPLLLNLCPPVVVFLSCQPSFFTSSQLSSLDVFKDESNLRFLMA